MQVPRGELSRSLCRTRGRHREGGFVSVQMSPHHAGLRRLTQRCTSPALKHKLKKRNVPRVARDAGCCDRRVWGPGSHARPGSVSHSWAPRQAVQGPAAPAAGQKTAGPRGDPDRSGHDVSHMPHVASAHIPSAAPMARGGRGTRRGVPRKERCGRQRLWPHGDPGWGAAPREDPVHTRLWPANTGSGGTGFSAATCPLPGQMTEEGPAAPASAQETDEKEQRGAMGSGLTPKALRLGGRLGL